jgi:hypothetical protein
MTLTMWTLRCPLESKISPAGLQIRRFAGVFVYEHTAPKLTVTNPTSNNPTVLLPTASLSTVQAQT